MKNLIIIGAGDAGKELASFINNDKLSNFNIVGFIDDNKFNLEKNWNNYPILSTIIDFNISINDVVLLCSITKMFHREKIIENLMLKGYKFTNYIHSKSIVNSDVSSSMGIIIYPNSIVSSEVKIFNHVFVNMNVTIGHNAIVNENTVISSHCDINGYVSLGRNNFVGSHSSFLPKVKTGDNVNIGIGSIVINDLKSNTKVIGYPAKKIF